MNDVKRRSFAAGYLLGLAGLPVAAAPNIKKPVNPEDIVAYLYNGVRHPPIPTGYDNLPCATMLFSEGTHYLYLSDVPFFARPTADGIKFNLYNNYTDKGVRFIAFQLLYDHYGNEYWSNIGYDMLPIGYLVAGPAPDGWANYDLPDLSGNIRIKATAPIPVTDKPAENALDNKLLMLGCRLGYVVWGQMGKGNAETDVPMGVLLSSDGYILCDSSGRYLIAKEDS